MTVRTQYEADLTALKAALVEMGQNSADAVEAALEAFFHLFQLAYLRFLRYNNPKDDRI